MTRLFYIMGPSGAGKDTVLRLARQALQPGERIAFAHRYITRPPDPRHENYISLNEVEFETRRSGGLLSFDWQVYGFRYGIGVEIETWRQAGFVVVVSGSREHFLGWDARPRHVVPVLITAPRDLLEQRLAGRGREDAAARARRVSRASSFSALEQAATRLDNSGPPEEAAAALLRLLRHPATPQAEARP